MDVAADEHPLEVRGLEHELLVLMRRAEAHHLLDAGPVVPGPVEHHDLPSGGQMLDVALEVPLRALPVRRLVQRHDARTARVEVLGEALDGAALAGGVAALEHQDDALPCLLDPALELEEFDLQAALLDLVLPALHALRIGVALAPRLDERARRVDQLAVVVPVLVRVLVGQVVESPLGQVDDVAGIAVLAAEAGEPGHRGPPAPPCVQSSAGPVHRDGPVSRRPHGRLRRPSSAP